MNRKDEIARIIFDWLRHAYAEEPSIGRAPFSFNDDDDTLTIGVDGELDCRALAEAIDKKLP